VTPDLLTRLAEWQRIARAATPGKWDAVHCVKEGRDLDYWWVGYSDKHGGYNVDLEGDTGTQGEHNVKHIATWSPARSLLVVEALRATVEFTDAKDLWQGSHCRSDDFMLGQTMARAEDKMRAALNALAALDSP
jgi:hypothetical protein